LNTQFRKVATLVRAATALRRGRISFFRSWALNATVTERLKSVYVRQSCHNKKHSYRRETARQLRTSFSARSLIARFTEHHICCIFTITLANVDRFQ